MNMSYAVFFVLVCLGPVAVICDQFNWVPKKMVSPANQCTLMGYKGQCKTAVYSSICEELMCAILVNDEYLEIHTGQGAWLGTQCGDSAVCKRKSCVKIPSNKMPKYVSEKPQIFDCVSNDIPDSSV